MPKLSTKNKNLSFIPALQSKDYAGFIKVNAVSSGVPSGWLECDGSAVSRTTYSDLFSAIGTDFGVGDGSTTFNLPTISAVVANTEYIIKAYPDILGPSVGVENLSLDASFNRQDSVRDVTIPTDYSMHVSDYTVSASDTITVNGQLLAFNTIDIQGNLDLTNGELRVADVLPSTEFTDNDTAYIEFSSPLDNEFSGGTVHGAKIGKIVTLTVTGAAWTNDNSVLSSGGIIPTDYQPTKEVTTCAGVENSRAIFFRVSPSGQVILDIRTSSDVDIAATSNTDGIDVDTRDFAASYIVY